ncbi:MAG: DNA primase [Firmicutes bacterium]|nr:DNA primase [Bacillota bacterium]
MAQRSYSSAIEEIKSRCNIVDVISPVVPLKRTGANWKGCCPFHKEKTPSFVVSEQRQSYHCFGCGVGGDVITFTEKYYNLDFPEAVEKLANQYGIQIDTVYSQQGKKREPYYELNKQAARHFYKNLASGWNPGLEYLNKRKLTAETVKTFWIGYAANEWTDMTDALIKQGADRNMLVELGLCSEKNKRVYDKYRSRLIFPIVNTQGKIIGFGGRIIGDGEPKYLNSPESLVFQKKNNLYGLNVTRQEIQKEGYAIVVEGYMDMVSLYQGGVKNAVATLGTALTPEQAKLLSRYTQSVVLCYDADAAGIKAAIRGIDVLRHAGLEVKVLHVDDGKDPDEYIQKHGRDEFINLVKNKALPDVEYKMALIARKYDVRKTDESIKFFRAAARVLKELSPVEQDVYIKNISSKYRISEGALRDEISGIPSPSSDVRVVPQRAEEQESLDPGEEPDILERTLIRLMIIKSDYFIRLKAYPGAIRSGLGIGILNAFEAQYREGEDFDIADVRDALDYDELEYFNRIMQEVQPGEDDEKAFQECIRTLEHRRIDARIEEIKDILTMSDETVDQEYITKLTLELQTLSKNRASATKAGKG